MVGSVRVQAAARLRGRPWRRRFAVGCGGGWYVACVLWAPVRLCVCVRIVRVRWRFCGGCGTGCFVVRLRFSPACGVEVCVIAGIMCSWCDCAVRVSLFVGLGVLSPWVVAVWRRRRGVGLQNHQFVRWDIVGAAMIVYGCGCGRAGIGCGATYAVGVAGPVTASGALARQIARGCVVGCVRSLEDWLVMGAGARVLAVGWWVAVAWGGQPDGRVRVCKYHCLVCLL